ncbi:MAG: cytochrome c biogenesis protein CcsA [Bacteroidota bacterium]
MIQKKIFQILFSTRLMSVLFIVFAVAMAIGTFVENSYTTLTAREWIYDAWWFEVIMVFFVINFIGNIFRYKLWTLKRLSTLLIHLSFILILLGAWVTRYIGFEGIMPIREGEVTNVMMSEKTYLSTYIDGEIDGEPKRSKQHFELRLAPKISTDKKINTHFNNDPISFEVVEFIHGAKEGLREDENGDLYLKLVESGQGQRKDRFLKEGEVANINNMLFAFNKYTEGAINITGTNDTGYTIDSPFEGEYMRMSDQKQGTLEGDSLQELKMRSLYQIGEMQFVFPEPAKKGYYDIVPTEMKGNNQPDGVRFRVNAGGESKEISMLGGKGLLEDMKKIEIGGYDIHLRYGSKEIELPFSLKLNDFIAEKHPGTEDRANPSYASFKSKVEVIDGSNSYPYEIYMNHVLDHGGYRFFQASFDRDEGGTVLSVNHDWWGTWITYIGYFLLYIALMAIMFDKNSRFGQVQKKLDKLKAKKAKLTAVLVLGLVGFSYGQATDTTHVHQDQHQNQSMDADEQPTMPKVNVQEIDSIIIANAVDKKHARKFAKLVIQDDNGRMKPANTYSSELLRKLRKKDDYAGLNSDQVMLSMLENPAVWYPAPLIYLKPKNDSLHNVLGIDRGEKYVALTDFFGNDGSYKLSPFLEDAYQAQVPNQFQKDFMEADQRVNLLYNALQGKLLRIFPVPGSETNRWVSYMEMKEAEDEVFFTGNDSLFVNKVLPTYLGALQNAKDINDYEQPEELLKLLKAFQEKHGSEVNLSDRKIDTEILYNDIDIFNRLFQWYLYVGLFMIVFVILRIFKQTKFNKIAVDVSKIILLLLFVAHTLGLIARWYIAGHAPWSDAYESMIYVAWATMFFGFGFGRKSNLTLASTAFVTAIILMVAHWNWMDPTISNLEPVLDSYWLMIHVAVIVGSYGPFTLGAIIGLVSLFLMMFTNKKNLPKMKLNIQELTYINELALTVGLIMLTIGNFLGGQWANESWGRYWGWDPKETWALISIFVYAFVIHMRLVPGLRGLWAFNWASVIAFGSILMTYFGVNFYLTGLHSYASGDQIISYKFIVISLLVWLVVGFLAKRKYNQFYANKKDKRIDN